MYLHVIVAYFLLFWWPEPPRASPWLASGGATVLLVFGKLPVIWAAATWAAARARRAERAPAANSSRIQRFYHQVTFVLSVATVFGLAADLGLTSWPQMVRGVGWIGAVPGLADLVILTPFFASLIVLWVASYPVERSVRESIMRVRQMETPGARRLPIWTLPRYLTFQVRHQLLIAAVPMTLILSAYRLSQQHHAKLVDWLRIPWVDQAVLALTAAVVFVFAPVLLRVIWATSPLPDGPLRRRLDSLCRRIGLRYRDILVWHSHHMMVNAAVMGLLPRVRYVLLSDALLDSMDTDRIECVFGHEAGHMRLHHIQYFLLFAGAGMLVVSGIVELLIRMFTGPGARFVLSQTAIEGAGFVAVLVVWGLGFGWVSRRFERHADVYGVRCLGISIKQCSLPCGRHSGDMRANPDCLCTTAAAKFASALDRVAVLSGIPHDEPSWRHSSIGSRIRFITSLAGDVVRLQSYERLVRRIKVSLWVGTISGLLIATWYVASRPDYRDVFMYNFVKPFTDGESARFGAY
ncbi:MAG: M48 family metalloprotease [Phycisphaerales bacterium]|nr:MAG: M48 family metalloprotease [Phycisphaerales bacterium]